MSQDYFLLCSSLRIVGLGLGKKLGKKQTNLNFMEQVDILGEFSDKKIKIFHRFSQVAVHTYPSMVVMCSHCWIYSSDKDAGHVAKCTLCRTHACLQQTKEHSGHHVSTHTRSVCLLHSISILLLDFLPGQKISGRRHEHLLQTFFRHISGKFQGRSSHVKMWWINAIGLFYWTRVDIFAMVEKTWDHIKTRIKQK